MPNQEEDKMKCFKCGSEWNSTIKSDLCPFCGSYITERINCESIELVLKHIVDMRGVEIYNKPSLLIGMLSDILPKAIDERRLIKLCSDAGVIKELISMNGKDENETSIIKKRVSKELQEHCFLNKTMADKFVYWISFSLGISDYESNEEKDEQQNEVVVLSENIKEEKANSLLHLRKIADEIESRVIVNSNITLALNENGTVSSTTVLDDQYKNFTNCMDSARNWNNIISIHQEDRSSKHIIGLRKDGKVILTKGKDGRIDEDDLDGTSISKWTNVKELITCDDGTYAITNDGKVLSSIKLPDYLKKYYFGQDKTEHLRNVEKILWSRRQLVCLKKDGTLDATEFLGNDEEKWVPWDEIKHWTNIKKLNIISGRMIGIKSDGTLIASSRKEDETKSFDFWEKIKNWKNVNLFYWGENELVALTDEGKILYASSDRFNGKNSFFREMQTWDNIVKVYFDVGVAAGLRVDGSIVVTQYYGKDDGAIWEQASKWNNLIGLVPGFRRIIGIKKDGTLLHVGNNEHGQGNIENFRLFHIKEELDSDLAEKNKENKETLCPKNNAELLKYKKDYGNGIIIVPFDELKYKEFYTEKVFCEAKKEYNKGNYEKALDLFEDVFLSGNFFAFVYLGLMHHYGEGVSKDEDIALSYFKEGASCGCPLSAAWITELVRLGKGYPKKDKELAKKIFFNIESDLIKMCNLGDEQAQYFLGYEKLWGVLSKKDMSLGFKYIQEAHSKGNKRAGLALGECYFYGEGTEKDEHKAFEMLHQNQNEYSMRGKYLLGLCYLSGIGTDENEEKAFELFAEAAKGGYGIAKKYLGNCYEYGLGTVVDYEKAFMWYKNAADNHGNALAELSVALMYKSGNGIEKNEQLARKYLFSAAEKELVEAQFLIGHEYITGEIFNEDRKKAAYWLEKAANQGDVESQILLGRLYVGEPFNDDEKAFKWFLRAANQKNAEAEYLVGGCYENEIGTSKDMVQANKWYRKAAGKNHPDACYELGVNYIYGDGVEKKEEYGMSLVKKAVEGNNDKAKFFLSKRYINVLKEKYDEAFNMLISINFENDNSYIGEAYYLLGVCYEKGLGCSKDKKKAKEYYQKADNRGYKNSKAKKFFW